VLIFWKNKVRVTSAKGALEVICIPERGKRKGE
jgi:hypothetical protein